MDGQQPTGKQKQKAAPRECSSTQVSVHIHRTDANLGHPAFLWPRSEHSCLPPLRKLRKSGAPLGWVLLIEEGGRVV
jgi:hypothetical protein